MVEDIGCAVEEEEGGEGKCKGREEERRKIVEGRMEGEQVEGIVREGGSEGEVNGDKRMRWR